MGPCPWEERIALGLHGWTVAGAGGAWQTGDDEPSDLSPRSLPHDEALVGDRDRGRAWPAPPLAQTPAERQQTAAYVAAFQNPDGGFATKVGQKSTLGSTSSAIRILGFVGGSIRDVPACIAYVKSCHDPATGGFAPTPGGKADVSSTAAGLMAVAP